LFNWKSKSENRSGYFETELLYPISPYFFDNKKKSACILSATSILKILLPDRQINKKIYNLFEKMLIDLKSNDWIKLYINWELSLIKELGFETNLSENYNKDINKALSFNRDLLMKNFIIPNKLKFPLFRSILENYFL
jgi:DNA repair protein RecO (recombination protein O)